MAREMTKTELNWFLSLFFVIGVILIIVGVRMKVQQETWDEAYAIITDIDTYRDSNDDICHNVYVDYNYKGSQYSGELDSYKSGWGRGTEVKIKVNPENPNKISYGGTWLLFVIGGSIFSGAAILGWYTNIVGRRENMYVMDNVIAELGNTDDDY